MFAGWRVSKMSRFAFPDLVRAFRDGERFGDCTMRVIEVDQLVLPTGRIVACDAGALLQGAEPAYTRGVPPGHYPVHVALLTDPAGPPHTVACARVRFQDRPVARWELALRPGWDPSTLKPGYQLGYGVDGGTGCFVDELAVARLAPEQQRYRRDFQEMARAVLGNPDAYFALMPPAFRHVLGNAVNRASGHGASAAVVDPESGANIVVFPSGWGTVVTRRTSGWPKAAPRRWSPTLACWCAPSRPRWNSPSRCSSTAS
jgi:Protein of unknown function (DUF4241)